MAKQFIYEYSADETTHEACERTSPGDVYWHPCYVNPADCSRKEIALCIWSELPPQQCCCSAHL